MAGFLPLSRVVLRPNGLNSLYMEQFRIVFNGPTKTWQNHGHGPLAYEKQHKASGFCAQQKRPKDNQPTVHWEIIKDERKISVKNKLKNILHQPEIHRKYISGNAEISLRKLARYNHVYIIYIYISLGIQSPSENGNGN